MQVVVVGSGRSGTSMITRMLSLCGLFLGEEEVVRFAYHTNEKGAWEHAWFNEINDRLLSRLSDSYANPRLHRLTLGSNSAISPWSFGALTPLLPEGWEADPTLSDLYTEAGQLIDKVFGAHSTWGWKMPRAAFTLPFWRRLMPEARFVVCVRNPIDFASSLDKYEGFDIVYSYALWLRYNLAILSDTRPEERFITSYEDYFPDYRPALLPLLSYLGLPAPEPDSETERALAEFHEPSLKHHDTSLSTFLADPDIPRAVKELYSQMISEAPHGFHLPLLDQYELIAPFLRLSIKANSGTEEHDRAIQKWKELSDQWHELEHSYSDAVAQRGLLDSRVKELERILDSRTHRIAAVVCKVLIKLRGSGLKSEGSDTLGRP